MASRKIWLCRACATSISCGCCSHSLVLSSMSVNRKVTVPEGKLELMTTPLEAMLITPQLEALARKHACHCPLQTQCRKCHLVLPHVRAWSAYPHLLDVYSASQSHHLEFRLEGYSWNPFDRVKIESRNDVLAHDESHL